MWTVGYGTSGGEGLRQDAVVPQPVEVGEEADQAALQLAPLVGGNRASGSEKTRPSGCWDRVPTNLRQAAHQT